MTCRVDNECDAAQLGTAPRSRRGLSGPANLGSYPVGIS